MILGLTRAMSDNKKVAVVTGAAGVLCSEMVKTLLTEGIKVAMIGRTLSKLEDLQSKLKAEGFEDTQIYSADVMDKEKLQTAAEEINKTWGRIDILVNGAGGNHPKGTTPIEQMTADSNLEESFFGLDAEALQDVNRLNFIGTMLPTQVFSKFMIENGGCVVNISSMAAAAPLTKVAAYSAAKAAVDNFTKWLSVHLAPMNIRVNAIAPGFFLTEQNRFLLTNEDGSLTARGQKILSNTPMNRFGDPDNLSTSLKFLISDASSFVTGIIIPVDGGFLAFSGV
jgi:NAD(P)-dependent dehydrogenase (short-subunit alcohol dehydrogenase family)